jgi:hypothetical protein
MDFMKGGEYMNLKHKITTGIAAGTILLNSLAGFAIADVNIHVSGNGSNSDNNVSFSQRHRVNVNQSNSADVDNSVNVSAQTGGNRASGNTGGDVSITTGDANSTVHISTNANINHAVLGGNGNGSGIGFGFFGNRIRTFMTGRQEVPGPGDPDGFGVARVRVNTNTNQLCINMWASNIDSATAAHIHEAPVGSAGPVVVTLPTPNASGFASGCVSVDNTTLTEIKNDPSDFYINVHNNAYPDGAVRGQLSG